MNNISDEQLVGEYLKGKEEALKILIERYFKRVYNFLVRFVGHAKEAEDLTQEVFLKIWKNLKRFDRQKSFKVWLWRIVRNTGVDHLRRKKLLVFSALKNEEGDNWPEESLVDEAESVVDKISRQEAAAEVAKALMNLSEENRAVLLMRYNQQLAFQEIADLLNEPTDTVKSRHWRGLMYLKRFLENQRGAPKDGQ